MHDTRYVDTVAALMESIAAQVRAAYRPGRLEPEGMRKG